MKSFKQKQITSISLWIGFIFFIAYCTLAFLSRDYANLLWTLFKFNDFNLYVIINFLIAILLGGVSSLLLKQILTKNHNP